MPKTFYVEINARCIDESEDHVPASTDFYEIKLKDENISNREVVKMLAKFMEKGLKENQNECK